MNKDELEDMMFDALYDSIQVMGGALRRGAKACVAALEASGMLRASPVTMDGLVERLSALASWWGDEASEAEAATIRQAIATIERQREALQTIVLSPWLSTGAMRNVARDCLTALDTGMEPSDD